MKKNIINMWKCFTHYRLWRYVRTLDKAGVMAWRESKNIELAGMILEESEQIWNKILS
jgi:hypothetical protein